jgi:hypothetical protein
LLLDEERNGGTAEPVASKRAGPRCAGERLTQGVRVMAKSQFNIREHMEVIGADGVHVGTVDKVEGERIKLTKDGSGEGQHEGHHHFLDIGLVAEVEGDKVRLSANADVAYGLEEEEGGSETA